MFFKKINILKISYEIFNKENSDSYCNNIFKKIREKFDEAFNEKNKKINLFKQNHHSRITLILRNYFNKRFLSNR